MTDGTDADVFTALIEAAGEAGAVYEVVAPTVGGVVLSDGSVLAAKHKIDGGPSVLFDAVAVLASAEGAQRLAIDKPTLDFLSDAFAHCKFIGLGEGGATLFAAAGLAGKADEGCFALDSAGGSAAFIAACAPLRHWARELEVDYDAAAALR